MSDCAQTVQAGLSLNVHVIHVLLELHASVICYTKNRGEWMFEGGCYWNWGIKKLTCGLVLNSLLYGVISVSVNLLVET